MSPIIFTPPLFSADTDRTVQSDAQGQFELTGVDPNLGVEVTHPDYLTADSIDPSGKQDAQGRFIASLELASGDVLTGKVSDSSGEPIHGVTTLRRDSEVVGRKVIELKDIETVVCDFSKP